MKYQVISAFRDRRTGNQIDPGDELPAGLDSDDIERLIAARCLRPVEAEQPLGGQAPASTPATNDPATQTEPSSGENDGAPGLFGDGAGGRVAPADDAGAASAPAGGRRGRAKAEPNTAQ